MASMFSRLSRIFSLSPEVTGYNAWEIGSEIGRGTTGVVYQVQNKHTGLKAAMKVVDSRHQMNPDEWNLLKERTAREANILKLLNHPSIVKIYDFFERDGKWYLVMELVTGGELLDKVQDHAEGRIPEAQAKVWFRQIVSAVQYCHEHLVIHRDLKLENVLIDDTNNVKITDFGFANFIVDHDSFMKTFCGSPMYAAPEIFIGVKYKGPPLDVWSMGVLLFTMLAGAFPWKSKTADYNLMKEVISGRFSPPAHMSKGAQSLIKSILVVNPDERPTPEQILKDPWLCEDGQAAAPHFLVRVDSVDGLNKDVLAQLEELGFDRETTISELMKGNSNLVKAAYDLLLSRQQDSATSSSPPSSSTPSSSTSSSTPSSSTPSTAPPPPSSSASSSSSSTATSSSTSSSTPTAATPSSSATSSTTSTSSSAAPSHHAHHSSEKGHKHRKSRKTSSSSSKKTKKE